MGHSQDNPENPKEMDGDLKMAEIGVKEKEVASTPWGKVRLKEAVGSVVVLTTHPLAPKALRKEAR